MTNYPIVLTGPVTAVVIGGGPVAERKVQGLLRAGADVTVISPRLSPELEQLAAQECIRVVPRRYCPGDLTGVRLAVAATNDPAVNREVADEAGRRGCLVNVVDDPARCSFQVPAVVCRGAITVGISTAAASPALARHLRGVIEASIGPEYEQLAAILAEIRPRSRALESADRGPALPWARLIEELLPLLRAGQVEDARAMAARLAGEAA